MTKQEEEVSRIRGQEVVNEFRECMICGVSKSSRDVVPMGTGMWVLIANGNGACGQCRLAGVGVW